MKLLKIISEIKVINGKLFFKKIPDPTGFIGRNNYGAHYELYINNTPTDFKIIKTGAFFEGFFYIDVDYFEYPAEEIKYKTVDEAFNDLKKMNNFNFDKYNKKYVDLKLMKMELGDLNLRLEEDDEGDVSLNVKILTNKITPYLVG